MTSKVPTAEEVLALVSAAATASEPTMQQLLLQVQQAQLLQHQQHGPDGHQEAAMGMAMGLAQHHAAAAADISSAAAAADAAMELMNAVGGVDAAVMAASLASMTAAQVAAAATTSSAASRAAATMATATAPTLADAAVATATAAPGVDASSVAAGSAIRRKSIPLSMKKQAIEWILGPGKGVPSRAEKHFSALNWDVSASSFRKWWKNRDKIMNDSSTKKRISGGGRKPYLEEGEERLLVIVIQERAKKDRVTRKWIAKTAQHMFQRTNANFKASENWVTKFIRRNGLTLKRSYVTYDHNGAATGIDAANGSAAQALGLAPGSIEVHEDDDEEDDDMDDDDDAPEDEQNNGGGTSSTDADAAAAAAAAAVAQEPADAYVKQLLLGGGLHFMY